MKKTFVYATCLGLTCSIYSIAADKNVALDIQSIEKSIIEKTNQEGLNKTLDINFSPEKRQMLRRALEDYARSIDEDHEQIEARRKAMQESIKARFFDADTNFDNKIDRQEATSQLPQIARHFSAVDLNEDGLISLDELEAAQNRMMARRRAAENAINMRKMLEENGTIKSTANNSTQAAN